jgi:hypothetical protein
MAKQAPVAKKPQKNSAIGTIPWGANNFPLIFQLLCEVEKMENFKVLFGRTNTRYVIHYFHVLYLSHQFVYRGVILEHGMIVNKV